MPRTCTICEHPQRGEIDRALVGGASNRSAASLYDVSEAAVRRHKANHLPAKLVMAQAAEEVAEADSLLDQVRDLQDKALGILAKVEEATRYQSQAPNSLCQKPLPRSAFNSSRSAAASSSARRCSASSRARSSSNCSALSWARKRSERSLSTSERRCPRSRSSSSRSVLSAFSVNSRRARSSAFCAMWVSRFVKVSLSISTAVSLTSSVEPSDVPSGRLEVRRIFPRIFPSCFRRSRRAYRLSTETTYRSFMPSFSLRAVRLPLSM